MEVNENNPSNLPTRNRDIKFISFILIATMLVVSSCILNNSIPNTIYAKTKDKSDKDIVNSNKMHQGFTHGSGPHLGLNMKGYYTGLPQSREGFKNPYPSNYYSSSFKAFSKAKIIDHVRYRIYWESYVKNPIEFINELKHVAKLADKYGIKVIYDNHQFHTSSWLDVGSGTGFPAYLFNDAVFYKQDSGGIPKSASAQAWWTKWWDRAIKSVNGTDGWRLQAEFLKKIAKTVDKHPSTLGYEILSEPQVHNKNQWKKIGKYNTFMTKELRKITDKTLIYSMNIPIDLKSPIDVNAQNLAKMAPENIKNVVFKMSLYGIPSGGYQSDKLQLFENTSRLAGVPLYVGEWNNVKRVASTIEGKKSFEISAKQSDISQTDANTILEKFRGIGIWGMAYWSWSFLPEKTPNFNLVKFVYDKTTGEGKMKITKYFGIMENAYQEVFGQSSNKINTGPNK
jgi:hypothetical protein